MITMPHRDDATPLRWKDLDGPTREACVATIGRLENLQKRATALDIRLRHLLSPAHVAALGVGVVTQWEEERLTALETLVALIPNGGGEAAQDVEMVQVKGCRDE